MSTPEEDFWTHTITSQDPEEPMNGCFARVIDLHPFPEDSRIMVHYVDPNGERWVRAMYASQLTPRWHWSETDDRD